MNVQRLKNQFQKKLKAWRFDAKAALLCIPAFAAALGYGVVSGNVIPGVIAAGGAWSVGFASFHAFTSWRIMPMLATCLGMALSAFVGSLVGTNDYLFLITAAMWAALCSIFIFFEVGAWWIMLQWAVALFVAGYYPSDYISAGERAGLILAGGLLQVACIVIGWQMLRAVIPPTTRHSLTRVRRSLLLAIKGRLPTLWHALHAALAVVLAILGAKWLGVSNGYWAPTTALIVIKPHLDDTRTKGLQRFEGTIIGALLATAVSLAAPQAAPLIVLAVAFAWLGYGVQKGSYMVFTATATATVIFMQALMDSPELTTAWHRLVNTMIGGGVALVIAYLTAPEIVGKKSARRRKAKPVASGGA